MSLMKSLVIPAALALSLVATESSASVKQFKRVADHNSKFAADLVCAEFKSKRGLNFKIIKGQVSIWLASNATNYPGTVYHRDTISGFVQQKSSNTWRCNMAWTFWYTYPR